MALTIRMRIDDNDEHQYYYATGSGTEIELIPLVVDSNGDYVPDEGKAYNRVTVNVPSTELETLIVNTNGTYNAPDGKSYNVVQVDVQSIINLQNKSASYTANGNYTIQADSGYDGLDTVSVEVNVPTSNIQPYKQETITQNGYVNVAPDSGYDAMGVVGVEVNVPSSSIQASKAQTITQNGTVTVSPDSGYDAMEEAEITVNVPTGGGATNIIEGSFSVEGNRSENLITIPYQGSGFLKALLIYPDGGVTNYPITSPADSELGMLVLVKADLATPPTFTGTAASVPDSAYLYRVYRSSSMWSRNGSIGSLFNANGTPAYSKNTDLQLIIKNNVTFDVPSRSSKSGTSRFALNNAVNWKYTAIYTE